MTIKSTTLEDVSNIQERPTLLEIVEKLRNIPVSVVSDVMNVPKSSVSRLRPMHGVGAMVGQALTVVIKPGDNLMVHKAIDLAEPGDVIVVDAGGDQTTAIIGEIMMTYALQRGVGGFVINGAIRDSAAIYNGKLPVYALGISYHGPEKRCIGLINTPVTIEDMLITPGDIVIGDEDGMLCVPVKIAALVCTKASERLKAEEQTLLDLRMGKIPDRTWVDDLLASLAGRSVAENQ
jgi:regulator of RNase E activity RraA